MRPCSTTSLVCYASGGPQSPPIDEDAQRYQRPWQDVRMSPLEWASACERRMLANCRRTELLLVTSRDSKSPATPIPKNQRGLDYLDGPLGQLVASRCWGCLFPTSSVHY
jgi:hypothetical protein